MPTRPHAHARPHVRLAVSIFVRRGAGRIRLTPKIVIALALLPSFMAPIESGVGLSLPPPPKTHRHTHTTHVTL